jgi:bifunctional non-homologous end joining protein LigD
VEVAGRILTVSRLDKVLFPEDGFTKGQMIDYYVRVADVMLPHLEGRPLTMKRYPDGVGGQSFFEKHVPPGAPRWIKTVTVPTSDGHGSVTYPTVVDLPTLVWAANLGAIELHVPLWKAGRRRKLPAPPDQFVVDLDPGAGTSIVECCRVALLAREELDTGGLATVAKTSGSKGLQLYGSLDGTVAWDRSREMARDLARRLEQEHPDLVVSNMRKELRDGRVLLDWSQNHPMKTTVAAYSLRARDRPTVSTPVGWDEVEACADSGDPTQLVFTAAEVLDRLAVGGDLFAV